ncbi:MAG: nucleotidyltransferase domain-containing protein [Nitrospiraceae bacterium]
MPEARADNRVHEVAREVARMAKDMLGKDVDVYWFGSWPQGRAQDHSDIDLAISAPGPIVPERMALLREAVEERPTLYQVDLVDIASAGPLLKKEILEYGVKL